MQAFFGSASHLPRSSPASKRPGGFNYPWHRPAAGGGGSSSPPRRMFALLCLCGRLSAILSLDFGNVIYLHCCLYVCSSHHSLFPCISRLSFANPAHSRIRLLRLAFSRSCMHRRERERGVLTLLSSCAREWWDRTSAAGRPARRSTVGNPHTECSQG